MTLTWDAVTDGVVSFGAYQIPFSSGVDFIDATQDGGDWTNGGSIFTFDPDSELMYAVLTPVPIPGAIWFFGAALELLGWMRRRAS